MYNFKDCLKRCLRREHRKIKTPASPLDVVEIRDNGRPTLVL